MQYVIIYRNPWNDVVGYISEGGEKFDQIAVFDNLDAAMECASRQSLCLSFPHQFVELSDL